jgi:hypothetical protein
VLAVEVVSSPKRIDWTVANDGARDMTILSIGATGGLFLNHQIQVHPGGMPLFGILAVLANLLLTCILVYRKRWRVAAKKSSTFKNVFLDVALGMLALSLTTGLFIAGYSGAVLGGAK